MKEACIVKRRLRERLSELFLDTEVRPGFALIALFLLENDVSRQTADEVWQLEIAPVLHWNLKSVAGEWAGFDLDRLEAEIAAQRRSWRVRLTTLPWVGPVLHRLRVGHVERDYRALWSLVGLIKQEPVAERRVYARLLHDVMEIYFAPSTSTTEFLGCQSLGLQLKNSGAENKVENSGAEISAWRRCFVAVEPLLVSLLVPAGGDLQPAAAKARLCEVMRHEVMRHEVG